MSGQALFVAYTLSGVKGDDVDDSVLQTSLKLFTYSLVINFLFISVKVLQAQSSFWFHIALKSFKTKIYKLWLKKMNTELIIYLKKLLKTEVTIR